MESESKHQLYGVVQYDTRRHRVWIFGQRCHHGATGTVVAAVAFLRLIRSRPDPRSLVALAATGGVLMAHDWKDHALWFERGRGSQP